MPNDTPPQIALQDIYAIWAKADHWLLEDAVSLALGLKPSRFASAPLSKAEALKRDLLLELALNCARDSLDLVMHQGIRDGLKVRPLQFLQWAKDKGIHPPPELMSTVIKERERGALAQEPKELPPRQKHRERTRAVAAMIWAREPKLTKQAVAERPEILEFGCEGHPYTPKAIEGWIKEENPNRRPGRRPKGTEAQ